MQKNDLKYALTMCLLTLYSPTFCLFSQEVKNVSIREVLAVGGEGSGELYQWVGITTDTEGFLYLSDAIDYTIKKYDVHGNYIFKTGSKGKGPGEFTAPRFMNYFGGKIYINDQNKPGIQVFDSETLHYLSNIPFELPISSYKVLSENRLLVSAIDYTSEEWSSVFLIDSLGNVSKKIGFARKNGSFISNTAALNFDKQSNVYIVLNWKDVVMKFNLENEAKLWEKSFLKNIKLEFQKIGEIEVPKYMVYKDVALDTMGNIFILSGHYSKNISRDVYVLSTNGSKLTTFTLPERSHCIYIDHDNYLYSRADRGTILKKYALEYEY